MQDSKKTRNNILRFVSFILILLLILIALSFMMEKLFMSNDDLVQTRQKSLYRIQREDKDTIDVLVIGDSLSYSAISPYEMWNENGMTAFVCGQPGQRIQEAYELLKKAFDNQSPKVVILEPNEIFRSKKEQFLTDVQVSVAETMKTCLPILRGHDVWKSIVADKHYVKENYKGYSFRTKIKPYEKGDYMKKCKDKVEVTDTVSFYLEKMKDLCKENGAELILVSTPSPKNCNYSRHNAIEALANEKEIGYLDLNLLLDELGINWKEDSLDGGDHLNLLGAKKVSKYLAAYLEKEYGLADHRDDETFAGWSEEAEEYNEKADCWVKKMEKLLKEDKSK